MAVYIGFWRQDVNSSEDLPFPAPDEDFWKGRKDQFLENLQKVESASSSVSTRGFSLCRLCRKANGSREYYYENKFVFPAGLRHYVKEHNVILPEMFVDFVLNFKE